MFIFEGFILLGLVMGLIMYCLFLIYDEEREELYGSENNNHYYSPEKNPLLSPNEEIKDEIKDEPPPLKPQINIQENYMPIPPPSPPLEEKFTWV